MSEKYGIKTRVLEGAAATPVSSASCLVYFGSAYASESEFGKPIHVHSYSDYLSIYHSGSEPEGHLSLDAAAEYALSLVSDIWVVNCNKEGVTAEADAAKVKDVLEDALAAICLNSSDVPNIICVPGYQDSELLMALVGQCKGGINNTIHAQGFVDCLQEIEQVLYNGGPLAEQIKAPNTDGCLIAAWGDVILDEADGVITKHIPASIVLAARRAEQDAKNVNGVPYRSVGNLRVSMKGVCIDDKVDGTMVKCTCRQEQMNDVVENGIVSFVNKGNNRWFTWGDHTAAVTAGSVEDETYRFDSTVAVLYHVLNRFIQKWGDVIDSPMSLRLRDCIISEEQDYLNGLKAMGCLVGSPKCEFRALDNSSDTIGAGQFYFTNIATVTPPAKYLDLGIQYTDAGLSAYIEA